jgi:hypothetical protein
MEIFRLRLRIRPEQYGGERDKNRNNGDTDQ